MDNRPPLPLYSDHQRLDARSLALHCIVAKKVRAEPALLDHVRGTLARWRAKAGEPAPPYFDEWQRILARSPDEIAGLLVSMSEEATRLRQSSPFGVLLTPEERAAVFSVFGLASPARVSVVTPASAPSESSSRP